MRAPTAPPCGPARRSRLLRATACPHSRPAAGKGARHLPGPGSYERNDAGDAGIDAALLSNVVGRPVRVQGMRWEGHGWDRKGPASIHRARAALDKDGDYVPKRMDACTGAEILEEAVRQLRFDQLDRIMAHQSASPATCPM